MLIKFNMSTKEQRGKELAWAMIRSPWWWVMAGASIAWLALLIVVLIVRGPRVPNFGPSAFVPFLLIAATRKLRLYEKGVELPRTKSMSRCFLEWNQIERYRWDGNKLTFTGPGGAEIAAMPISKWKKRRIEPILSARLAGA